ncbi:MAG TPA: SDR family oxidoreductase [Terriglobales bacterium]|jgi:short-subunit dehydrogenase|nr:SDR family oxidoreductase [Terriglobales bacterium]
MRPYNESVKDSRSPTALITGASFGIGQELAGIFAREGYNLVLVARTADKLRQLASELEKAHGTRSLILASDLSAPGAAAYLHDQTTRADITLDVLVNNAGFGQFGLFAESDLETCLQQIQLNITTLTHLTRLYLPEMLERKSGRILNVASTAAFQAGPLMSVYYATKAYVLHFSEGIANELHGSGVTVTCLCPGPTVTEFHKRANMLSARMLQFGAMDAHTVAEDGYRALMAGRPVVISGFRNWLLAQSVRFSPRRMVTAVARKLQEARNR